MLLKWLTKMNRSFMELVAWLWLFAGFALAWILVHLLPALPIQLDSAVEICNEGTSAFFLIFGSAWFAISLIVQMIIFPPLRILFTIDERIENVTKKIGDYEPDFADFDQTKECGKDGTDIPLFEEDSAEKKEKSPILFAIVIVIAVLTVVISLKFYTDSEKNAREYGTVDRSGNLVLVKQNKISAVLHNTVDNLNQLMGASKENQEIRRDENTIISASKKDFSMTDSRDGKRYRIVQIGEQVWMAENLKYRIKGSSCYDTNCERKGMLYNFRETKKDHVCPNGWRMPSTKDWKALFFYIGAKAKCENFGYENEEGDECDYLVWDDAGRKLNKQGFSLGTNISTFEARFATKGKTFFNRNGIESDSHYCFSIDNDKSYATDYCCQDDCDDYVRCIKD